MLQCECRAMIPVEKRFESAEMRLIRIVRR